MSVLYRKAMDALYLLCVIIAGVSLVLISAVIPWAVYTRYVINRAASWPEPMAVLLTIVPPSGAAVLPARVAHERDKPPPAGGQRLNVELLKWQALFMLVKGTGLVEATWSN
jgi:hypothetical protein